MVAKKKQAQPLLFTMGHSTLPMDEFIERLKAWRIDAVIDIRTIPKSKRNPQFCKEALAAQLKKSGISYFHLTKLGGLRKADKSSINDGWRNLSFRGYADYMQTQEFKDALEQLIRLAKQKVSVILCAEAVPWRCHRSLVADALVARGYSVEDIFSNTQAKPHRLNPMAEVIEDTITYPLKNPSMGKAQEPDSTPHHTS